MKDGIKSISLDDIDDNHTQTSDLGTLMQQGPATVANSELLGKKTTNYLPSYGTKEQGTQSTLPAFGNFNSNASAMQPLPDGNTFSSAFSRLSSTFAGMDQSRKKRLYFLAGGFIITLAGIFFLLGNDETFNLSGSDAEKVPEAALPMSPQVPQAAPPVSKAETPPPAPPQAADEAASLYWPLPNPLENATELAGSLSQNQEGRFRDGLNHPFSYQRFKTVEDIRRARLKGSEFILTDAMGQAKFWTRMEAVLALTEMGEEIEPGIFAKVVSDTRPELIKNYFRRFRAQADAPALYVMRQALRVVDADAREIIIQNLARHRDPINDLYLLAASRDPHPPVQALAVQELKKQPPTTEQMDRYQALANDSSKKPEIPAVKPELSPFNAKDTRVEELPSELNVEEVYFLNEEATQPPPPKADESK